MHCSERQLCLQIGKMLVFQSGAVKVQLGDVLFDVLPGTEAAFRQDIAAVNAAEQACVFLGGISQRVVACPDIAHLLRFMTHPTSWQSFVNALAISHVLALLEASNCAPGA